MKVLGFMACHYVGSYFRESLLSVRDHVDKFHISFSKKPSHGFGSPLSPPETEWEIKKIAEEVLGDKLIFTSHDGFNSEQEHRNMRYKHSLGFSVIFTIDPDEIWVSDQLNAVLWEVYQRRERFYGVDGFVHFWRGHEWYFVDNDLPIRFENLTRDNTEIGTVIWPVCHMSLAQNEQLVRYKISCYGHRNEIRPGWIDAWLNWTPDSNTRWLHPTRTDIWETPIKFEGSLPELLKNYVPDQKTPMKLLWIPMDYDRHHEAPYLFTSLLNGLKTHFEAHIYVNSGLAVGFKPDVILFQASVDVDLLQDIKKLTGALVLMYTGDATYSPPASFTAYREVVDGFLTPFKGERLAEYQSLLGKPCHFLWEAVQDWRFFNPLPLVEGKISFVGNYYDNLPGGQDRLGIITFVNQHLDDKLHVYGSMPAYTRGTIDFQQVPQLYNESYAVICENNYVQEGYFTPRNLGALAAGSCAFMRYFPGIEQFFQNTVHCLYYNDKYELLDKINYLKANPEIRNQIASNGRTLAENYKPENWAFDLKKIIENFIR